jgi:hypothetical protein
VPDWVAERLEPGARPPGTAHVTEQVPLLFPEEAVPVVPVEPPPGFSREEPPPVRGQPAQAAEVATVEPVADHPVYHRRKGEKAAGDSGLVLGLCLAGVGALALSVAIILAIVLLGGKGGDKKQAAAANSAFVSQLPNNPPAKTAPNVEAEAKAKAEAEAARLAEEAKLAEAARKTEEERLQKEEQRKQQEARRQQELERQRQEFLKEKSNPSLRPSLEDVDTYPERYYGKAVRFDGVKVGGHIARDNRYKVFPMAVTSSRGKYFSPLVLHSGLFCYTKDNIANQILKNLRDDHEFLNVTLYCEIRKVTWKFGVPRESPSAYVYRMEVYTIGGGLGKMFEE